MNLLLSSKGHCLPETQVKFLFNQLITAVSYLHANGVVHRDLKPENVLLRREESENLTNSNSNTNLADGGNKGEGEKQQQFVLWRVVVADFGFATWAGTKSNDGGGNSNGNNGVSIISSQQQKQQMEWLQSVVGTPSYMAPEIVDNRVGVKGYDHQADLWSCGVILYIR